MSSVYLASRIDDFEKEVAIKVILTANDHSNYTGMFRRERQILAGLEHPNIARILDGGSIDSGKPFIVMEYVDGLPLDEYCRTNDLSLHDRLRLFQDVCETVAFAHRNLIVHRDLKPKNILVTRNGVVKLLDFGIAKLLDKENFNFDENKTIDGNALTLDYASPEQIKGSNITVASDVYSLGVILYELLTGQRPHNLKNLSLGEIVEIIKTKEPPDPSTIINSNSDVELDAIIMRSLAKTPESRYKSIEDLHLDIDNYLKRRPISARPNTPFYKFRKAILRHKIESVVTTVIILLTLGWLATALLQSKNAAEQAYKNRRAAYSAEMILAAGEYQNANLNRLLEIVEKYAPRDGEEDIRGFEWFYLSSLLNPDSKIRSFRHENEVWSAEFSPDGKLIASACNDNRSRIWNIETGKVIQTAEQPGAWKPSFYPDGNKFAVASSSTKSPVVKVYDTTTAQEIMQLIGHTKRIRAVDVAPDGKTIATGSQDGTIRIWDSESGAELKKFEFGSDNKPIEFYDVLFSGAGDHLAILGFQTLAIYNTKTWERITADNREFIARDVPISGWKLAFSPLGKTIAVGTFEGDVVLANAQDLKILRILKLHQSNVKSLAFTADGRTLITGSWDRTIKFTDVQSGELINEIHGHFAGVHEVLLAPDNQTVATASADFNLTLWNTERMMSGNLLLTGSSQTLIAKSADYLLTWKSDERTFAKWNTTTRKREWSSVIDNIPLAADESPEVNRVVTGDSNGNITLFDAVDGSLEARQKVFDRGIYAIKFSPDGRSIFAASEDGKLKALDGASLAERYSVQAHEGLFKALDVSPDGKFIATGGNDNQVKILHTENGDIIFTLAGNTKALYRTVFSGDSKYLVSVGADDVARIWQISDGKLIQSLSGMSGGIFAAAFSPDGKRLATASDVGIIRLWDIDTGNQVFAFPASNKKIDQLRFSADSKTLVSCDITGRANIWSGK